MNKRKIGDKYENMACRYLRNKGMEIIERNYRRKIGEIDIVAADGQYLVFVEVKYRKNKEGGGAFYAISGGKKQKIKRVAMWYMAERRVPQSTYVRFDAVLIEEETVNHIENAWQ